MTLRIMAWSLFVLVTLGAVSFNANYLDGLQIHYESWVDKLVEKVRKV